MTVIYLGKNTLNNFRFLYPKYNIIKTFLNDATI